LADTSFAEALRLLGRVAVAVEPYAGAILVIGGMVPLLYRSVPGFARTPFDAPGTTEVDMSVPPRLPMSHRPILDLLTDARLVAFESPGYRGQPGAQAFQDADHGTLRKAPTFVEFLAPLLGKGQKTLVEVQPGFRAEALRYLDLLAFEPIALQVRDVPELTIDAASRLQVPQPAMYVAQKILARSSGRLMKAHKAAKDLAYVFDVAVLSRPIWSSQHEIVVRAAAAAAVWRSWLARAGRQLKLLFETPASEGPIEAARILRDLMGTRAPSEEDVQQVVTRFVEQVFTAAV
jgi:hypothetical protein